MSLARTALRLAVIEALRADPVITALCAGRIFDSRIGDLSDTEPVPLIVVMTENDSGVAWSVNNGGPPFKETCELVLEISLRAVVPEEDDPTTINIETPYADAELEIGLDLLEQRAIEAIAAADTAASRHVRSTVLRRVTEFKSVRYTSDETGAKLAARLVTISTQLKGSDPEADLVATGPFALLPSPLRAVCEGFLPTSSGYGACSALAAQMTSPNPIIITGADFAIQVVDGLSAENPPSAADPAGSDIIYESNDLP